MKKYCFFILLLILFPCWPVSGHESTTAGPSEIPDLIAACRLQGPLKFCGEAVPLENPDVRERLEKEMLLILWDRAQIVLWLKRAGRYLPHIEKSLKKNGMPDDLKYVAVIESGLRGEAGSSKGAVGFWQFIQPTGQRYGLTVDYDKDERRNLSASTDAAIRYFKDLFNEFNSWTLAAAAYNTGEERIRSEIELQGVTDFYRIDLPQETERYILKILVAKMIMTNPERYGFFMTPDDRYPELAFDRIILACEDKIPVRLIADAAGSYYREIKILNPEIRGQFLPKGSHLLALPPGTTAVFNRNYPRLLADWNKKNQKTTYVVKNGDNLSTIAERFEVPLPDLLTWNELRSPRLIYPGQKLIIRR